MKKIYILLIICFAVISNGFSQTYSAFKEVNATNNQTISATVDPVNDLITMTITGNDNRYFAFGFGSTTMSGSPYCINTNNSAMQERTLAFHGGGTVLSPEITVLSNTTSGGIRTVELTRALNPAGNYFDFSGVGNGTTISIIWAYGFGTGFGGHNNRGGTTLTFTEDCFFPVTFSTTSCEPTYTSPAGNPYNTSGTYTDTLTLANACDTIYTFNLDLFSPTTSTLVVEDCFEYTVPSGDETYTATGLYTDTIPNANGCDSIISVDLTINSTAASLTILECEDYTVPSGDETYTVSGIYMDTIPNAVGCDSIITLDVTINNNSTNTLVISACESYTSPSGDFTYTTSGNYMDTISNVAGCDSILMLDVTINNSTTSSFNINSCVSYTVPSGDETYTTSGIVMDTISNANGCDSVMTINLTILETTSSILNITTCNTYTVPSGDEMYITSGTYLDTLLNTAGCDSLLTINLTIEIPSSSITIEACDSYTSPDGSIYTSSGMYQNTIPGNNGCDSIVNIDLTINTITAEANFGIIPTTGFATPNGADSYQWIDCTDNSIIVGETSTEITPGAGEYAVIISNGNCVDTSDCIILGNVGVEEINLETKVILSPNPTTGILKVEFSKQQEKATVNVRNVLGALILSETYNAVTSKEINIEGETGVYFVEIKTADKTIVRRIVKR